MSQVQVYGHFSGYRSFANVSRAIVRELQRGRIQVTACDVSSLTPTYDDMTCPALINSHAPIGIFVGYPTAAIGWLRGHAYKAIMTVCEAEPIPPEWTLALNGFDHVFVPSKWCAAAFFRSGVKVPITVAPHGIEHHFLAPLGQPPEGRTRFLHVSGARSFPQRKGTPQLLAAWSKFSKEHPEAVLHLKADRTLALEQSIHALGIRESVTIFDKPLSVAPRDAPRWLRSYHAVVQPSRGEGFGMVPLEARAAGVPCLLTAATGHLEHFHGLSDVEVRTGHLEPLQTQGNEVGSCPTVSATAVYYALDYFMKNRAQLERLTRQWAEDRRERWIWPRTLAPLVKALKPHAQHRAKGGASSGLRGLE